MYEISKCPCGMDHHPAECLYMDFAECDLCTDGLKFWFGRAESEGYDGDDDDGDDHYVEMIVFNPGDGGAFSLQISSADARSIGEKLLRVAESAETGRLKNPAIDTKKVRAYYKKTKRFDWLASYNQLLKDKITAKKNNTKVAA